jgi:hypothetical protein
MLDESFLASAPKTSPELSILHRQMACDVLSPASPFTVRFSFFLLEKLVKFVRNLI